MVLEITEFPLLSAILPHAATTARDGGAARRCHAHMPRHDESLRSARVEAVTLLARQATVLLRKEQQHVAQQDAAEPEQQVVEQIVFRSGPAAAGKQKAKSKPKLGKQPKLKAAAERVVVLQAVAVQKQSLSAAAARNLGHLLEQVKTVRQAETAVRSAAARDERAAKRRAGISIEEPIEIIAD